MNQPPILSNIIIIENGSRLTRVGYAGESGPRVCFPTIEPILNNFNSAQSNQNPTHLPMQKPTNPVEKGQIINWEGIIANWDYIFKHILKIDAKTTPVLLIVPPLQTRETQQKIAQILFEQFHIPALYLKSGAELILRQVGKETGFVMHFGGDHVDLVPILEGSQMPHLVRSIEIGNLQFTPKLIPPTLIERIYETILQIETLLHGGIEFRKICVQNIVIAGEIIEWAELAKTLQIALINWDAEKKALTNRLEFRVTYPADPNNSAWLEGAKYALSPECAKKGMNREKYQEIGPAGRLSIA